jgi:hypothetical protein
VVGDVAAAVGLHQFRSDVAGRDEDVVERRPHPERVDVRVLEQEEVVGGPAPERVLERVRVAVADAAEPADAERHCYSSCSQSRVSMISLMRAMNADA